jgi:hypothetical protein
MVLSAVLDGTECSTRCGVHHVAFQCRAVHVLWDSTLDGIPVRTCVQHLCRNGMYVSDITEATTLQGNGVHQDSTLQGKPVLQDSTLQGKPALQDSTLQGKPAL